MPHKTVLTVAVLAAATLVSAFAAEPVLEFKVNKAAPRTAGMCGPTHDEEVIFGLGSDGKQHYFAVGTDVRGPGITIWQSEDMVNWKDVGRVFTQANKPAILENGGRGFAYTFRNVEIGDDGAYKLLDTPAQGNNRLGNAFWAPCIYYHVYDQTYYLYYCCSAFGVRNSFIGCAKSKTLDKGWTDCGQLIHTRVGDGKRFNAIDPAVIHNDFHTWMVYGSYFGGIALVELDPKDPSKLLHPGTHGKTVASRTTDEVFDISTLEKEKAAPKNDPGAGSGIEGASILYHRYLRDGYYYLFVSYDNLEWSYHCRVGRSKDIEGPYLDYNGKPLIYDQRKLGEDTVYGTKIIGPYRWKSTGTGWAGTGHTTVFEVQTKEWEHVMFGSNSKWEGVRGSYLGLRRVFWSKDGWPLLSPCLYAGEDMDIGSGSKYVDGELISYNTAVRKDGILNSGEVAQWDFIVFSQSQDRSNRRTDESTVYTLKADGTIEGGGKWQIGTWNSDMMFLDGRTNDGRGWGQQTYLNGVSMLVELPGGVKADGVCAYGWDQDRKCQTVFFTGLTDKGVAVWGQRIPPQNKDKSTSNN